MMAATGAMKFFKGVDLGAFLMKGDLRNDFESGKEVDMIYISGDLTSLIPQLDVI